MDSMNDSLKPESTQVFLVLWNGEFSGDMVEFVFLDRGRALNMLAKLKLDNPWDSESYRVEVWREGDAEGEEIKPD